MAIYIGNSDIALRATADGTPFERKYYRELKEIDALFDRFRNKDGNSIIQISKPDVVRVKSLSSGRLKRLPPTALPVSIPYYDQETGSTSIRYSKTPPTRGDGNKLYWDTRHVIIGETMSIGERDNDLAWFLLYASNLVKKGIYQMVDQATKYEGSFNDIIVKKDVINALDPKDEPLVKHIAQKFVHDNVADKDVKRLIVDTINWCDANKKWEDVWNEIKKETSNKVLTKEKLSVVEWEGEEVSMVGCPIGIKQVELIEQAKELGIPVTAPPQKKDILYSLIQHVQNIKEPA